MSLLEAAAPFDDRADEASRIGGVDDAGVFLGRMMASAQTGFQGWGECFHRFWLAEEESHTWAMVPEPQRKVLLDTTIPGCAYEIGSIDGARGESSTRDLGGLAGIGGLCTALLRVFAIRPDALGRLGALVAGQNLA